ncbi:MAG: zinc ribbon domain-containing protein [Syntrophales bacterium]|nr:zinc ribbon domain-containing protein [Syntrophales bacterium]
MPDCPYCQEPTEENALFCRSCGASLRLPEYDRAFCPHCGARVSARQEFCHECHWSLVKPSGQGEEPEAAVPTPARTKPSLWKSPWFWGLLVVVGLVVALLPWLFVANTPPPPKPASPAPKIIVEQPSPIAPAPKIAPEPAPAPAAPAPATPGPATGVGAAPPIPETPLGTAVLKDRLSEPLNQLREAQLKKDISLYTQAFTPNFPDFDKRRQKTLAVWKAYDYASMDFQMRDIKLLKEDQAFALVTWDLKIQQKANQTSKTETQSYKVWFSKGAGKWRISNLELVQKTG